MKTYTGILSKQFVIKVHVGFWGMLLIMSTAVTSRYMEMSAALPLSIVNMLTLIPLVYAFLYFFIPKLWETKKYPQFLLIGVLTLITTAYFRLFFIHYSVELIAGSTEMLGEDGLMFQLIIEVVMVTLLATPFRMLDIFIKKIKLETQLKTQKLESELEFLKAQIQPHFLFNALNNLYSLTFTKSDLAPEMMLKLSDMMHYMLYECHEEKVLLVREIEYLKNYISFQQLKSKGPMNISIDVMGEVENVEVIPMFFISFYENAFKHGNLNSSDKGFVKSQFTVNNNVLVFTITNSKDNLLKNQKSGGVGLSNTEQRLNLLYQDKHVFHYTTDNDVFEIKLELELI